MHTHTHTLLPVRKQTHKGSKRERCKVQSEVEGRRREAGQTAEEERVLQKGGNPELDALAVVLLRDGWRTRDTRSQERRRSGRCRHGLTHTSFQLSMSITGGNVEDKMFVQHKRFYFVL